MSGAWWWVEVFPDGDLDARLGACAVSALGVDDCWDEAINQHCAPYGGPFQLKVSPLRFTPSSTVINRWLSDEIALIVMNNWSRWASQGGDPSILDFHVVDLDETMTELM